ncbi:MAG: Gp15 family bacteriophage protein [Eubacteriales bacterium]
MKQPLYAPLPYSVVFGGKTYKINPYFDCVLEVFSVFQRDDLTELEKVDYALFVLVKGRHPVSGDLLNVIFDVLVDKPDSQSDEPKSFDFEQDAAYIYAGFKQAYGIDLYSERGKLHWWKFIALFGGLPENTRIREIMSIRARKIPTATKYNGEEINQLIKLKAIYALKISEEERDTQFKKGLQKIAGAIFGMAK